jgi:hypothetical protein
VKYLTVITLAILSTACALQSHHGVAAAPAALTDVAPPADPATSAFSGPFAWLNKFTAVDAQAASKRAMAAVPPDTYAADCYNTIAETLSGGGSIGGPTAGALDALEKLRLFNRWFTSGGGGEKLKAKCGWLLGPGGLL